MNDPKAQTTLNQADELFDCAKEELARPEEDVVGYLVCHNAFKSVERYLTAYLMEHGRAIYSSMSIEEMMAECRAIDIKFNDLNLDALFKTKLNEDVYMDMSTVNHFITLAEQTRWLVGEPVKS